MKNAISRREILQWALLAAAGTRMRPSAFGATGFVSELSTASALDGQKIKDTTFAFIQRGVVARIG